MSRKNYWFLVIILFAVLSIFICTNIPFQLGLDLRGGSQLTLEVQPTEDIPTPYNGNLENLTIIQPHQIVDSAVKIINNSGVD